MKKFKLNVKFTWKRPSCNKSWDGTPCGHYSWENGLLTRNECHSPYDISYTPLYDNAFFAKFADIESSPDSFLRWANKYGTLFPFPEQNSYDAWKSEHADLTSATDRLEAILEGIPREAETTVKIEIKILLQTIENKLKQYPLILQGLPDYDWHATPTNLLSAFWWQILRVLNGDIAIRRCSVCGQWEDMAKHRSNWHKHDKCANKERVARYKQKQCS